MGRKVIENKIHEETEHLITEIQACFYIFSF